MLVDVSGVRAALQRRSYFAEKPKLWSLKWQRKYSAVGKNIEDREQ